MHTVRTTPEIPPSTKSEILVSKTPEEIADLEKRLQETRKLKEIRKKEQAANIKKKQKEKGIKNKNNKNKKINKNNKKIKKL